MVHIEKELNRPITPGDPMGVTLGIPAKKTQSRHHSPGGKLATIVVTLFGFSLLLAACSSSSPSTSKPTSNSSSAKSTTSGNSKTSSSVKTSFTAYSNCMKEHGVNFGGFGRGGFGHPGSGSVPSSSGGSAGTGSPSGNFHNLSNNPAFKKAEAACASLRPKFPAGGFGSNSAAAEKFAAYTNCLKLHGVNIPSPASRSSSGTTPTSPTPPSTLNSSNPTVKTALAACASLKPTFSRPTTSTSTAS